MNPLILTEKPHSFEMHGPECSLCRSRRVTDKGVEVK